MADIGSNPAETSVHAATAATAPVPPLPTALGAYVRVGNHWLPLPRNNGHVTQTADQALAMLWNWEGQSNEVPAESVAELIVDGRDPVPVVPASHLVLLYVGRLKRPSPQDLALHPVLRTAPAVELAPLSSQKRGVRRASLYPVAPGYIGFGPTRVAATIEEPGADVIILQCAPPADATPRKLAPGRYAFLCGPESYEVEVGG